MAERKEPFEIKINSFDELKEEGVAYNLNLDEDAWEYVAPPPRGVYPIKCYLGRDGEHAFRSEENDPKSLYCNIDLEGKIVNAGEFDDTSVFATLTTRLYSRRSISTMASFLVKIGARKHLEALKAQTPRAIAALTKAILLKNEPTVKAELDWKSGYMGKDKKGNEAWVPLYNHYEEFPEDPSDKNKRVHIFTFTDKDGMPHEVKAMLKITKFFGKDDKLPDFKSTAIHAPVGNLSPVKLDVEEVSVPTFAQGPPRAMAASASSDDVSLMLEP